MNWYNLKRNKCPQCSRDLSLYYNAEKKMFTCCCGFKISIDKMKKIVTDTVKKDLDIDELMEQECCSRHNKLGDETPDGTCGWAHIVCCNDCPEIQKFNEARKKAFS